MILLFLDSWFCKSYWYKNEIKKDYTNFTNNKVMNYKIEYGKVVIKFTCINVTDDCIFTKSSLLPCCVPTISLQSKKLPWTSRVQFMLFAQEHWYCIWVFCIVESLFQLTNLKLGYNKKKLVQKTLDFLTCNICSFFLFKCCHNAIDVFIIWINNCFFGLFMAVND